MTQINYSDLMRESPLGELKLEIRSPDNDTTSQRDDPENTSRDVWGGFQSDFEYRVICTASGQTLWIRSADRDSWLDSPNDAWVSDSGRVVVITRGPFSSHLVVLDTQGEIALQCDVLSKLLNGNVHELRSTSAGPHWNERGVGLFFQAKGREFWAFRTAIGRQVVVDLEDAAIHNPASFEDQLRQLQSKFALSTLQTAYNDNRLFEPNAGFLDNFDGKDPKNGRCRNLSSIWAAVTWAGRDGLEDAVPFLQVLEESTVFQSYTGGWKTPEADDTAFVQLRYVSAVQNALRCLKCEPAGVAPYWLCRQDGPEWIAPTSDSRLSVPERIPDRNSRMQQVLPGMTPYEVTQLVGMPDVEWRHWDYDFLSEAATVRLNWDVKTEQVESIENHPPAWHDLANRVAWI